MSTKKPPTAPETTDADVPAQPAPEPPAPEPYVSVREWGETRIATVGYETIAAFVRGYGADSARASDLENALRHFLTRPV